MLGIHVKTMAQELSNKLAAAGVQDTGEVICVNMYFTAGSPASSTCLTPNNFK